VRGCALSGRRRGEEESRRRVSMYILLPHCQEESVPSKKQSRAALALAALIGCFPLCTVKEREKRADSVRLLWLSVPPVPPLLEGEHLDLTLLWL